MQFRFTPSGGSTTTNFNSADGGKSKLLNEFTFEINSLPPPSLETYFNRFDKMNGSLHSSPNVVVVNLRRGPTGKKRGRLGGQLGGQTPQAS